MLSRRNWLSLALAAPALAQSPTRWRSVLNIDNPGVLPRLFDACFLTPRIGLAAGVVLFRGAGSRQSTTFHTEDQGQTWVQRKAPDLPLALFALDESHVWMLGERRLWFSADAGWTWHSSSRPRHAVGIHFLDPLHGFAFGGAGVHRTTDGGRHWSAIPASADPLLPQDRQWRLAAFSSPQKGWIAGVAHLPPAPDARDPFGEPLTRAQRRDLRVPGLVLLQTTDGGASWTPSSRSAPGEIVSLLDQGDFLTCIFLGDSLSRFPGVVVRAPVAGGSWRTLLQEEQLSVRDLLYHQGELHAAADRQGRAEILTLDSSGEWRHRPIHYTAQGHPRFLRGPQGAFWLWLDTGMIFAPVS